MQRSYSDYEYFASGRKNCLYAHFRLALRRRHCLLTSCTYDIFYGTADTLTIEAPIDRSKELPLEFFICRKKDYKQRMAAKTSLNDMVGNSNAKNYKVLEKQPNNKNALKIFSEHDEISNQLIDAKVGELLTQHGSSGLLH